jgi:predicted enzyme related to lactoylglutathione lyase
MQHNAVGWFEIYVQDMPRARRFYEQLLGRPLEQLTPPRRGFGSGNVGASHGKEGMGASGALVKMPDYLSGPGGTLVYFVCEDCAEQVRRADAHGGRSSGEVLHRPLALLPWCRTAKAI